MILPPDQAADFFKLAHLLDAWFRSRLPPFPGEGLAEIHHLRTTAYADPRHIKTYISENPDKLSGDDLDTIASWQAHGFATRFLAITDRKASPPLFWPAGAGDSNIYQVHGLTQPLADLLPHMPCYVETRLLPFRGHIISDGILAPVRVRFSARMAKGFLDELREKIGLHGITTSLPAATAAPEATNADQLKYYLSTPANRRDFAGQIQILIQKSPALRKQYLQHLGKSSSSNLKANLKSNGITTGYFAILGDTVLTGALTKSAAIALATQLLPSDLHEALVWIKL